MQYESLLDDAIFDNENEMMEYVWETIGDSDIVETMELFDPVRIFENLNEDMKMEILDKTITTFIEKYIEEIEVEEEEEEEE